ncbi:uncharacterized protein LOC116849986 isoform X3 [Odontomachus brunneus]|uniref:uncharacterized protein LOC116849986 isoform X3 n=1 Tax=Odontomachus brunneus TaxID=486640 RepID=UPI0013F28F9F|nr:uncharacterized protein LOC116849986 isoform X3 [Odontomachus brunneus]
MNWRSRLLRRVQKDADDDDGEEDEDGDDRDDERGDDERVLRNTVDFASETWATVSTENYAGYARFAQRAKPKAKK